MRVVLNISPVVVHSRPLGCQFHRFVGIEKCLSAAQLSDVKVGQLLRDVARMEAQMHRKCIENA